MPKTHEAKVRHLVLVLGDQLNENSAAFDDFDKVLDAVLRMEVADEATYVPQHKIRLALFFSAMRHFRLALEDKDYRVHYVTLEDDNNRGSFAKETERWVHKTRPQKLILCKPGDYRAEQALTEIAKLLDCKLEIRPDRHFFCGPEEFQIYAKGRESLRLEAFYREMRRLSLLKTLIPWNGADQHAATGIVNLTICDRVGGG